MPDVHGVLDPTSVHVQTSEDVFFKRLFPAYHDSASSNLFSSESCPSRIQFSDDFRLSSVMCCLKLLVAVVDLVINNRKTSTSASVPLVMSQHMHSHNILKYTA